ncbi:YdcF family protein [bacterium]|nr:YdcF family protein [bacterium]
MGMKEYNKFTGKKILLILVIVLAFFILIRILIIPQLGQWLVVNEEVKESDVILVLMGSVYDRILEAVDLYQERHSDKIILINSYIAAKDIIIDRGLQVYGNTLLSKMAASDMGIPEEDIIVLDGNSRSTQDEAMTFREYVKKNEEIDSIIIVTTKFHSRRAKQIFIKALSSLDREIEICVRSSKYDMSNVDQWWRNREDFEWVVFEYLKLAHFWFREQFLLK